MIKTQAESRAQDAAAHLLTDRERLIAELAHEAGRAHETEPTRDWLDVIGVTWQPSPAREQRGWMAAGRARSPFGSARP